MAHLYAKAPPAFAKDPWAWDYTRDRIENNTGLPYDQWQGKHFAGAAAMYKNVVKKYRDGVDSGKFDAHSPRECVDCGGNNPHYDGDYICTSCRDQIENAGSYAEAAATITQPESIDAIRDQLYKALGHDKKDAKAGRVAQLEEANPLKPGSSMIATGKVSRNYRAMSPEKLARVISELEAGEGEAMRKVKAGEDPMDHLEAALRVQQTK